MIRAKLTVPVLTAPPPPYIEVGYGELGQLISLTIPEAVKLQAELNRLLNDPRIEKQVEEAYGLVVH